MTYLLCVLLGYALGIIGTFGALVVLAAREDRRAATGEAPE